LGRAIEAKFKKSRSWWGRSGNDFKNMGRNLNFILIMEGHLWRDWKGK
jgi:hypothetical protein